MQYLLDKVRKISKLTQEEIQTDSKSLYAQIVLALSEILNANIYIIDDLGELVGYSIKHDVNNERVNEMLKNTHLSEEYTNHVTSVQKTEANIDMSNDLTAFPKELQDQLADTVTTIVPIICFGKRLGTIILGRIGMLFDDYDLVLAEYSATVVGLQMINQYNREIENNIQRKLSVQMAMKTLSFTEIKAVEAIFRALAGQDEGRLVASTIADQENITRSVIVNALRKLESAGIIDTRSLGMKGTYVKIINPYFAEYLNNFD